MKPYIYMEKPHDLSQVTELESSRGEGQSPLPHVICRQVSAWWLSTEKPGVGRTQRMFGHGLMATWRVRASGLWGSVPNSALINQWLTKKKQSEGHHVCQGQETLNTYSGHMEEWGIVQIQTEWARTAWKRCGFRGSVCRKGWGCGLYNKNSCLYSTCKACP